MEDGESEMEDDDHEPDESAGSSDESESGDEVNSDVELKDTGDEPGQ